MELLSTGGSALGSLCSDDAQRSEDALRIEPRDGDDARIIFRRLNKGLLQCGVHWKSVPVREPPSLPSGATGRRLLYHDDSTRFMDADLTIVHSILRDHAYEKASGVAADWSLWWHSGVLKPSEIPLLSKLRPHRAPSRVLRRPP